MKERIKQVRKSARLTQADFSRYIGVKPSTIAGYETGVRIPSEIVIIAICRQFGINREWLETGKGSMVDRNSTRALISRIEQRIDIAPTFEDMLRAYIELLPDQQRAIDMLFEKYAEVAARIKPDPDPELTEFNRQYAAGEIQVDEDDGDDPETTSNNP